MVAEATVAPTLPSPEAAKTGGNLGATLVVLLIVVLVFGGAAVFLMKSGGGGVSSADAPPVGQMWFGDSFDPTTFALSGRRTTVSAHSPFAVVAHLPRAMDGSALDIRTYWNGSLVATNAFGAQGSGEFWGWSPAPLIEPGDWRYELTDLGGNVLASGTITAT